MTTTADPPPYRRIGVLAHASVLDGTGYARRAVDSAAALVAAFPSARVCLVTVESPRALRRKAAREAAQAEARAAGLDLRIVHGLPRRLGLARLADSAAARSIGRLVAELDLEALHAHGPRALAAALAVAGRRPVAVVADVHGDRAAERRLERGGPDDAATPPDAGEAAAVAAADGAVYASAPLAARFPAGGGRPVTVVPCLVRDDRVPDDGRAEAERVTRRRALGLAGEERVLAYAGSLAPWQEAPRLARVVAYAAERVPQLRFLLLTPSEARGLDLCRQAGLARGAYVVRAAPATDVVSWLAAADAGIVLRRRGLANALAYPTKFAEYLAAGLRVVVSDAVPALADEVTAHPILGDVVPWASDDATWAARSAGAARPDGPTPRATRRAFVRARLTWRAGADAYRRLYAAVRAARG